MSTACGRRPGTEGRSGALALAVMLEQLPAAEQGSLQKGIQLLESRTAQCHPAEEREAAAEALGMLAAERPESEGGGAGEAGGRLPRPAHEAFGRRQMKLMELHICHIMDRKKQGQLSGASEQPATARRIPLDAEHVLGIFRGDT